MDKRYRQEYLSRIVEGVELLEIPIHDYHGTKLGILRPVTKNILQFDEVIEKMTLWRNQNKVHFLTQFHATPERTKQWLANVVLTDSTRMLFLIYSGETLMGHYGFKCLRDDDVEVDNLLRGERGGHPLLMRFAVSALVVWLFNVMRVNEVYGYIFANNAMALKLHKDLGFSFVDKIPLLKQVDGDEIKWIAGKAGELSPDNRYCQKVVIRHI